MENFVFVKVLEIQASKITQYLSELKQIKKEKEWRNHYWKLKYDFFSEVKRRKKTLIDKHYALFFL